MQGHVNLCNHAADEKNLREIWDADLKKCITRRLVLEWIAVIWALLSAGGVIHPNIEWFIAVLIALVYGATRQFIDESNVNYLMHMWEWRTALRTFGEASGRNAL